MKRQLLALVLSGAMVFGTCASVFADEIDSVPMTEDVTAIDVNLEKILGSFGKVDDSMGTLLGSVLGGNTGDVSSLVTSLLGSQSSGDRYSDLIDILNDVDVSKILTNEEGAFELNEENLNSILRVFGSTLGIELSGEELNGLVQILQDPKMVTMLLGDLFKEGQIGDIFLDHLGNHSGTLESILDTVEDGEDGYDVEKIMNVLYSCREENNSIVIEDKMISEEELTNAVTASLVDLEQKE